MKTFVIDHYLLNLLIYIFDLYKIILQDLKTFCHINLIKFKLNYNCIMIIVKNSKFI